MLRASGKKIFGFLGIDRLQARKGRLAGILCVDVSTQQTIMHYLHNCYVSSTSDWPVIPTDSVIKL